MVLVHSNSSQKGFRLNDTCLKGFRLSDTSLKGFRLSDTSPEGPLSAPDAVLHSCAPSVEVRLPPLVICRMDW